MSIVFCPFCGKEITYKIMFNMSGRLEVVGDTPLKQECACSLEIVQDTLLDVAFGKMLAMIRVVVENSEAR